MALRACSLAALAALAPSMVVGFRDASGGETNCVDTDNGAKSREGWTCDMFDSLAKCSMYAASFDDKFNAQTMCCACGGGSALQAAQTQSCPATCWGEYTCDDWVNTGQGNTCESLEAVGCQCGGCACSAPPPAGANQYQGFQYMGSGACVRADGVESASSFFKYLSKMDCANICMKDERCTGFLADEMLCYNYFDSDLVANADPSLAGSACYAKGGAQSLEPARGEGAGGQDGNLLTVPYTEAGDQATQAINVDAAEHLGAVSEDYEQTFKFNKQGIYTMTSMTQTEETCFDTDRERCSAEASEEACINDAAIQTDCKRSCNFCQGSMEYNYDFMAVVKSTDGYRVVMGGQPGGGLKGLVFKNPFEVKHKTWVVQDESGKALYTIQRRAHKQDCRYLFMDCKTVWKIYQGDKKNKKLTNYGIQHKTSFKFYKSRSDFKSGTAPWIASYQKLLPTKENGDNLYKVTVKPGEDGALMMLAAYAIFKGGDLVKVKSGVVDSD